MTRLFLFDMDDVLYDYNGRARLATIGERLGLAEPELRRRWWNLDGEGAAKAGAFEDGAAYLRAVNAALDADFGTDEWTSIRRSVMTPWPEVIAVLGRLGTLGRVSLLTNNGPLVQERITQIAPELVPLVEPGHLRTSCYYGARKPDPELFLRVLDAYGGEPRETFFTDDLAANVDAAASVGIRTHRFDGLAGLELAIDAFVDEND